MANDQGGSANNLLSQFERAYAETMATMTQEDTMCDKSPEVLKSEIDTKVTKFTDLARQMETFFLQKQFILYAHKPELHLKDESTDLRQEIARKDELIRKHNDKLDQWLKMLQDLQQQQRSTVGPNAPMASPSSSTSGPGSNIPGGPKGTSFPAGQSRLGIPGSPSAGPPTSSAAGPLQFLEKTTTSIGNNPR